MYFLGKCFCVRDSSNRTRTLSKIIDRITEPSKVRRQGSPEKTLKELVNEVAKLDIDNFLNEDILESYIGHEWKTI